MCLTIAYSKIKKRNLVLINNVTHQRETLSERPIRLPLTARPSLIEVTFLLIFQPAFCVSVFNPQLS